MISDKRKRLLELISEKERVDFEKDYDFSYFWLEELEYLFGLIKNLGSLGEKVSSKIKDLRSQLRISRNHAFFFTGESVTQLKEELEVFKKYEIETVEFE